MIFIAFSRSPPPRPASRIASGSYSLEGGRVWRLGRSQLFSSLSLFEASWSIPSSHSGCPGTAWSSSSESSDKIQVIGHSYIHQIGRTISEQFSLNRLVNRGTVKYTWTSSETNLADVLTKPLGRIAFERCIGQLMVIGGVVVVKECSLQLPVLHVNSMWRC